MIFSNISKMRASLMKKSHLTCIDSMQLRSQSKHLKTLHHHLNGSWQTFPPAPLGQALATNQNNLNMLRAINVKPRVSANTYLHQQHDYNKRPLAHFGCPTMTHNKLETRTSWGPQATKYSMLVHQTTLLLLQNLGHRHMQHMHLQCGPLPPQIHHDAKHH